jgi:hypothetical protein
VVLAVSALSDPYETLQKKDVRPDGSTRESVVRREGEPGIATGVSEARSHQHRGTKTPTLVSPGREAVELEISVR